MAHAPSPVLTPLQQIAALHREVAALRDQVKELAQTTLTQDQATAIANGVFWREQQHVATLADHATKALALLVSAGTLTQDAVNEAIR